MSSQELIFFFDRNFDNGRREHVVELLGEDVAKKLSIQCPFCDTITILYHTPINLGVYYSIHRRTRCQKISDCTLTFFVFTD